MRKLFYSLFIISLMLLSTSCKTTVVEKSATTDYILLVSKTETTVIGAAQYTIQTQYIYDTLLTQPVLKQEIMGNEILEYSYPSQNKVITKSIDKTTKKTGNTTYYTLDSKNRNVLNQIDDLGVESKFNYDAEGYLIESDFEDGTTYEHTAGNLSKKNTKYDTYSYTEEFTYGSELLKTAIVPFFFGKPNKNILINKVSTTTTTTNSPIVVAETIATTLTPQGFPLIERTSLGVGYIETKYEYKTFKK